MKIIRIMFSLVLVICLTLCLTLGSFADEEFDATFNASGRGTITISRSEYYNDIRIGSTLFYLQDIGNGRVSTYLNIGANSEFSNPCYMYVYSREYGISSKTEWVRIDECKTFATPIMSFSTDKSAWIHLFNYYYLEGNSNHYFRSEYEVLWSRGPNSIYTINDGMYYQTILM